MKRYCMVNVIKEEKIPDYIHAHKNPWPELLQCLKDAGTLEEYIYIYNNLAIVCLTVENDIEEYLEKFGNSELGKKWLSWMSDFIAESPFADECGNANESSEGLEKVFDLNQQLEGKLQAY